MDNFKINKHGIECYIDSTNVHFRGILDSEDDIWYTCKSLEDIQGDFENLDLTGLFNLIHRQDKTK